MKLSPIEFRLLLQEVSPIIKLSKYLTPQNLATEREKFFADSNSNPQFVYEQVPIQEVEKVLEKLQHIELTGDSLESHMLRHRLQEIQLECQLLIHRDTEQITQISTQLYQGSFSDKYRQLAEQDAAYDQPFVAKETLTGEQTVTALRDYLSTQYHQNDWDISVSDQGDFYVRVKAPQKKILINRNINWDFTDLDCMLAHEVDGHILRYLNAQQQTIPFLTSSLPFYIKTEEGLASFLGDYCSEQGKLTLKHHALKYLAGIEAIRSSFREVFNFLVQRGFTPSLAFQRTFRLKRGLSDTAQSGCFAKEALYYEGLVDVKEYIDQGKDIRKLFSGKFGLQDLELIPEPQNVVLPQRLERYLHK